MKQVRSKTYEQRRKPIGYIHYIYGYDCNVLLFDDYRLDGKMYMSFSDDDFQEGVWLPVYQAFGCRSGERYVLLPTLDITKMGKRVAFYPSAHALRCYLRPDVVIVPYHE